MNMLINCTNHPYEMWGEAQRNGAGCYGSVLDFPFPQIDPRMTTEELRELAGKTAEQIEGMHPEAVLLAGEFSFTFMLADKLLTDGVRVVCSCSRRMTTETKKPDGTVEKTAVFAFEGFRDYAYYEER